LQGELDKYQGEVKRAESKLGNDKFMASAPADVVEQERKKLADWLSKYEATISRIEELS
jgi:valyl-tRNA synthetase